MIDERILAKVEDRARRRLARTRPEIEHSLDCIARGVPLAAESSTRRRIDRISAKSQLSPEAARMLSNAIGGAVGEMLPNGPPKSMMGAEAIWGTTLDFVGVGFLEKARRAADAVGRIARLGGEPHGTGFLVGPGLLLTNHHVIPSPQAAGGLMVQFEYETDAEGQPVEPTAFVFDPETCFISDGVDGLDFTLIAVGARRRGARILADFGYLVLSDSTDKHMLGELANIIQHPQGRHKELVLRENHLVARDETENVLHYVADTETGSSGSPVFNNQWEPIALHHWGSPWREVTSTSGRTLAREINEGIRISAIVQALRAASAAGHGGQALARTLALWAERFEQPERLTRGPRALATESHGGLPRVAPDGAVTWTIPLELSLRLPSLEAPPASSVVEPVAASIPALGTRLGQSASLRDGAENWRREDFSDRGGFEQGFIPGFVVPLPNTSQVPGRIAKNQEAEPGDDPYELRYHHFSILMHANRRLACVTAVNIDGARLVAVNRATKTVTINPTLSELGAEASDDFRPDRRILPDEQMNKPFYENQVVRGFLEPSAPGRIARMFQKGHIILRSDPAWGLEDEAVAAERDTFFYTNAAPQVGFFNQGSRLDRPGTKGRLRWRAVETYVLRNAFTQRSRISVFAGPVFADEDPEYRFGAKVPMRFWKLATWSDGAALRAIALLADQRPVLDVMPEAMGAAEGFTDSEELARVSEFLSTVEEIEELTKLDFGQVVRAADVRAGAKTKAALDLAAEDLSPRTTAPKRGRRRTT